MVVVSASDQLGLITLNKPLKETLILLRFLLLSLLSKAVDDLGRFYPKSQRNH